MGVKQSKRSVDITETSTKGEIEGFGNEGKVEKIIDGVVEKVAVNGHVDGDLQNGIEPHQNGGEILQNGEAATIAATEKVTTEKKDSDGSPLEGVVNGTVENGEVNGESEKTEEAKKLEEKKEKKKEKKIVKKKFSFRNFSFSKKDKSKPPKDEKTPEKVDETGAEEVKEASPEKEETPKPVQVMETSKVEQPAPLVGEAAIVFNNTIAEEIKQEIEVAPVSVEVPTKIAVGIEELPPPLPASPPPSEPIEGKLVSAMDKLDLSEPSSENPSGEIAEVSSSISSILTDKMEQSDAMIKYTDNIVIETGKQIEEKATSLLKAVEEKAGESMKAAEELVSQQQQQEKENAEESCQETGAEKVEEAKEEEEQEVVVVGEAKTMEDEVALDVSNLPSLVPKQEETTEKVNPEEGAGESLADMPKDLTDEMRAGGVEAADPDSLEIPAPTPPPPVVEPVTGE